MFWIIGLTLTAIYYVILIRVDKKRQQAFAVQQDAIGESAIPKASLSEASFSEASFSEEASLYEKAVTQMEPITPSIQANLEDNETATSNDFLAQQFLEQQAFKRPSLEQHV